MAKPRQNLYNAKILQNFVTYLRGQLGWTDGQVEALFEACGSHVSIIDSDDNWFDQEFADGFHEKAVQLTRDPDLAYKVGGHTLRVFSNGIGGRLIQGFLSPAIAFRNIQTIAGAYTRGSYYEAVEVTNGRAVIRSKIVDGCDEKPYQCRNRIGMLEAIPAFFGCSAIVTRHEQCLHRGDDCCEYVFTWRQPLSFYPLPLAILAGTPCFLVSFFLGDPGKGLRISFVLGSLVYIFLRELLVGQLRRALAEQKHGLEESVATLMRRRDEQILLREVMKRTTEMMPIGQLCTVTVEAIQRKMQYDRVILALVDRERSVLKIEASVGYDDDLKRRIEGTEFGIRPENQNGFFVKVVNTNQPVLEHDVEKSLPLLSERTQSLVKAMKTRAFVAVPISFKGQVLGVLSVENKDRFKPLDVNDRDLMASLGDHIAVAISNARSFEEMNEALRRTTLLERDQRLAKEEFQKYVPTEVLDHHGEDGGVGAKNKLLSLLFVDIIGFTSLSERRRPDEVAEILSVYIDVVNEIVTGAGGQINKIIGDGLLIHFEPSQANAIEAGQSILGGMKEVNRRLVAKGYPSLDVGIGAHQGYCTLGNIGCNKRLDYTVIGDAVNTASRIERSTRRWGKNLFCFSSTLLPEAIDFDVLSRGTIPLDGRTEQVQVFELRGYRNLSRNAA